ncbi:hypothetical protein M427DRAFT_29869 [Gonapodya prolifera JEL478]|uniref:Cache domain-containing protein n=1 Tax=Gonapodya prolifera (strain JEL478) TaxID=1344416 RepID=A0A139ANB7_GONPJ|nr:hypothetical protein M427DRAFT_29869 [Gonapodya prolifera JEL478]|eukprot:KXS18124.1 hypothetical protein M427DRAFT_29869 [Gonapodya prolifera JEL478]
MSSPASATASAMMSGLQSRRASEPLSAIPEHRVSVSSPSDNTLNQQSGTIEHKKPWYSFTMRAAIVFLVFSEVALVAAILTALSYTSAQSSNADAVGQGTSSIKALANALQHDASFTVKNHMDSYLRKLYGIGNNTASLVRRGVVNPRDFDTILPLMKDFLVAANVSIMYYHFWINSTLEDVGVGQIMYSQGNFIQNTGGRITYWFYNETSNQAQGLLSQTAPGFQAWTRPWYKDRLPLGQPFVSPIYFSVVQSRPTIIQSLTFSLWDSSNNFVGVGPIVFSVYDLSRVLDGLKASSTPNSLYYILTPDAEVLAMSGLGADQSTLMRPVGSTYALNSIFTYNDTAYPLLNISSATIFEYSGRNLSRDFVDMEFAVGDFLFQVTSYSFANYKWIIVSGAPATDYLGDTLILQDRLADRLWTVERNIIVSVAKPTTQESRPGEEGDEAVGKSDVSKMSGEMSGMGGSRVEVWKRVDAGGGGQCNGKKERE